MNEKTTIAISGYSGDQHQIESNWPVYAHHQRPIMILSPGDAPVQKIHDAKMVQAGKKGWIGPHTLERQRDFLRILLDSQGEFFLFNDADSVCLSPEIPKYLFDSPEIFWSNEVLDTNPSPSHLPKLAFQPPYFFSKSVLRSLVRCSGTPALSFTQPTAQGSMPLPTECIDHWMLQIVYAANISHRTFPDGASWETTSEHGLNLMSEQVRAHGKIFIHQVKTKSVLDRLMADRNIFQSRR
jgi:hypothetical protein